MRVQCEGEKIVDCFELGSYYVWPMNTVAGIKIRLPQPLHCFKGMFVTVSAYVINIFF